MDLKNEGGERRTLVEEGTEFTGSLSSKCPILVKGRIEGEIAAPALTVSSSGAVHGRAKVGEIRSDGELSGEFDADAVQLAGIVRDKTVIRAKSLEVKLQPQSGKLSVVFGECDLEIGEAPTRPEDAAKNEGGGRNKKEKAAAATPAKEPEGVGA